VQGRGPNYVEAKRRILKSHPRYKTAWGYCEKRYGKIDPVRLAKLKPKNKSFRHDSANSERFKKQINPSVEVNDSIAYDRATAICRAQAELASEQAAASYTPRRSRFRTYNVSCSQYGRYSVNCYARDMTPTGGKWAGINEALEKKCLKDKTYNAVFDSCMAQMGHF